MTGLPLTVIGGYLGAGKTTLINRILSVDHGLRLVVLVNDFGAINIDARLLASSSEDTIALTNGCVCCTMGADLFSAVGKVLDRIDKPDHLFVEASGIGNPARIANLALAEPELRYSGIVCVVDGLNFPTFAQDPQIGPQVSEQVQVADLVAISKTNATDEGTRALLADLGAACTVTADDLESILALALEKDLSGTFACSHASPHPSYRHWTCPDPVPMSQPEIECHVRTRPRGVLRLKGFISDRSGGCWEVQVVGKTATVSFRRRSVPTGLVAVGIAGAGNAGNIEAWWRAFVG